MSTSPPTVPERILILYVQRVAILLAVEGPTLQARAVQSPWKLQKTADLIAGHDPWTGAHVRGPSLIVWDGQIPPQWGGLSVCSDGWRPISEHEGDTIARGKVPFGRYLPPVSLPFLMRYTYPSRVRGPNPLAGMIARSFAVEIQPVWEDLLYLLGFSPWQIDRILAMPERGQGPRFVPFGGELLHGPNAALLPRDTTCRGCSVRMGERHVPTCPARECFQCGDPLLAAGDLCALCRKRGPRSVPRADWGALGPVGSEYNQPDQLSARCKQWWERILYDGWRPNRRIRMMGYYDSAEWYGVYIWEYLYVIWPLIDHLEKSAGGIDFRGSEFGLTLPTP